ncbi:FGGY family carbohydrate kinase [Trichothermofontia sp.]
MGIHPYSVADHAGPGNAPIYGLGIDFGTSGARAVVVEYDPRQSPVRAASLQENPTSQTEVTRRVPIACHLQVVFTPSPSEAIRYPTGWPLGRWPLCVSWQLALITLLEAIPVALRRQLATIAINGTSSTVLLCDATGQPVADPLLYNDDRAVAVVDRVRAIAPPNHLVASATSSLSKVLWWQYQGIPAAASSPLFLLHQADWLAFLLHGRLGISDTHNVLKLGYDVVSDRYPGWVLRATAPVQLPQVVAPGTAIGPVRPEGAEHFQLNPQCRICAGTTDSVAAFLASGATRPGEAVTSLGSTLVLKLLSETRIEAAQYGIYSHRLGDRWLVGGHRIQAALS